MLAVSTQAITAAMASGRPEAAQEAEAADRADRASGLIGARAPMIIAHIRRR
jgi:hypothetical protein